MISMFVNTGYLLKSLYTQLKTSVHMMLLSQQRSITLKQNNAHFSSVPHSYYCWRDYDYISSFLLGIGQKSVTFNCESCQNLFTQALTLPFSNVVLNFHLLMICQGGNLLCCLTAVNLFKPTTLICQQYFSLHLQQPHKVKLHEIRVAIFFFLGNNTAQSIPSMTDRVSQIFQEIH